MTARHRRSPESRPLGSFERAQVLTGESSPYNLVTVLRIAGALPGERLRRALDRIQRRTPLLRARVEGSGRRAAFSLGETPPIPLCRESGAPGDWRHWMEKELATGFDVATGPLARCLHLTLPCSDGTNSSDLFLAFHHAIADGLAVARLLEDLVSQCAAGPAVAAEETGRLPPSADERFPARVRAPGGGAAGLGYLWRQGVDEISYRWRRRRRPARPPPAASRCRVLTTSLSERKTAALVAASHDRGVSLTAALQAAMLLAVSRHRYGGARLPQRYFAFPILRPHLEPPIEPGVFGGYLTALRFTVDVAGSDDLWRLAAAIGRQIDRAAGGDEKYLASIWSPLSMRMALRQKRRRMGTTALSYTGPLTLEASGRGSDRLEVRDLHVFVSNFALGPEYTAQVRIFRRRLVWDVVTLDGDMTNEEALVIAEEMKGLLLAGRRRQLS